MLRHFLCAALALLLLAGLAPAEKKKAARPRMTVGKIKKIDAKKGTLILLVGEKDEEKEVKIKIDEDTKFIAFSKGKAKEMSSEDAADSDAFKPGTVVRVMKGPEGELHVVAGMTLKVPPPPDFSPGGAPERGKIKKIDADKGTVTVTVTEKGKITDKELTVEKDTMVMVFSPKSPPKMVKGKAALKGASLKAGDMVMFKADDEGHLKFIGKTNYGKPPDHRPNPMEFTVGIVKEVDVDKDVLTVKTTDKVKPRDLEVKVDKNTRFVVMPGKGKSPKEYKGKAGLKAKELKPGAMVRISRDPEGRQVVMVMNMPRPKSIDDDEPIEPVKPAKTKTHTGKIKKVDAEKGTLTLTVKEDDEETEVVVKVSDKTKFVSGPKDDKKELSGKKGLKEEAFKVGTEVTAVVEADSYAKTITAKPPKGKLEE
jgi:hypothetical protein